jgi:hypothetical protein
VDFLFGQLSRPAKTKVYLWTFRAYHKSYAKAVIFVSFYYRLSQRVLDTRFMIAVIYYYAFTNYPLEREAFFYSRWFFPICTLVIVSVAHLILLVLGSPVRERLP